MTEPLTPAAGSRIAPLDAETRADIRHFARLAANRLCDHLIKGEIDAARNRGDHETAEKWEAILSPERIGTGVML